jgi:hypothetical protein
LGIGVPSEQIREFSSFNAGYVSRLISWFFSWVCDLKRTTLRENTILTFNSFLLNLFLYYFYFQLSTFIVLACYRQAP